MNDLNDYIYSSVPEDVETDYTDDNKNAIRKKFMDKPNTLFSTKELEEASNLVGKNPSMRKIITELIENEGFPIVSTSKGYKLTTFKEDVDKCIESLEKRAMGLQRRIDGLRKARGKING